MEQAIVEITYNKNKFSLLKLVRNFILKHLIILKNINLS